MRSPWEQPINPSPEAIESMRKAATVTTLPAKSDKLTRQRIRALGRMLTHKEIAPKFKNMSRRQRRRVEAIVNRKAWKQRDTDAIKKLTE